MMLSSLILMKTCRQVNLTLFKVGDGSAITIECFNAADAHKLIKDSSVVQVELLWWSLFKKYLMNLPSVRKKCAQKSKRSYWQQI